MKETASSATDRTSVAAAASRRRHALTASADQPGEGRDRGGQPCDRPDGEAAVRTPPGRTSGSSCRRRRHAPHTPVVAPPVGVHRRQQHVAEPGLVRMLHDVVRREVEPEGCGSPVLAPLLGDGPAVRERAPVRRGLHDQPRHDEHRGRGRDARERPQRGAVAPPEPVQRQPEQRGGECRQRPGARQVRQTEQPAGEQPGAPAEAVATNRAHDDEERRGGEKRGEGLGMEERSRRARARV